MLILLGLGMLIALTFEPVLIGELGQMSFHLRLPTFALTELWQSDLVTGVLVLGLPHCWRVHVEYGRGIWSGTRTLARLPTRMAQSLNEPSSVASYSLGAFCNHMVQASRQV